MWPGAKRGETRGESNIGELCESGASGLLGPVVVVVAVVVAAAAEFICDLGTKTGASPSNCGCCAFDDVEEGVGDDDADDDACVKRCAADE